MHVWDAARGALLCTVENAAGTDPRQGYCGRLVGWVRSACLVRGWALPGTGAGPSSGAGGDGGDSDSDDEGGWRWEEPPRDAAAGPAAASSAPSAPAAVPADTAPLEALAATCGGDETVRLWRLSLSADGSVTAAAACPPAVGHTDAVTTVRAADPRGTRVLSCSGDGSVRRGIPSLFLSVISRMRVLVEQRVCSHCSTSAPQVRLWDIRGVGADQPPRLAGVMFGESVDRLEVVRTAKCTRRCS